MWSLTEPGTPPPDRRVEALRRLTAMGVPCGVLVAPVLPGLSDTDDQLREVVEACAEAGAVSIAGVALHLRGKVRDHWFEWLRGRGPTWSASTASGSDTAPTRRRPSVDGSRRPCAPPPCAAA